MKKGAKKKNVRKNKVSPKISIHKKKSKTTAKSKAHISKKSKSKKAKKLSSPPKHKQVKYDNFLVTFTAIRSYEYNRPTELEVFTRSIPVYPAETLAGFKSKYLAWIIEEEMNTFKKITEDTDGKVYWHSWIYEVKAGEEEF